MPEYEGGGNFEVSKFNNPIELILKYVMKVGIYYEHLNARGLINRGRCPFTGDIIETDYYYDVKGRRIYISKIGNEIIADYEKEIYLKSPNVSSMTVEEKRFERDKYNLKKLSFFSQIIDFRFSFRYVILLLIFIITIFILLQIV